MQPNAPGGTGTPTHTPGREQPSAPLPEVALAPGVIDAQAEEANRERIRREWAEAAERRKQAAADRKRRAKLEGNPLYSYILVADPARAARILAGAEHLTAEEAAEAVVEATAEGAEAPEAPPGPPDQRWLSGDYVVLATQAGRRVGADGKAYGAKGHTHYLAFTPSDQPDRVVLVAWWRTGKLRDRAGRWGVRRLATWKLVEQGETRARMLEVIGD